MGAERGGASESALRCEGRSVHRPITREKIDALAGDPHPPGATSLEGRKGAWRMRVGDYRLLYEVHATEIVVYVIGIAHRREVYLRLLRRR